MSSFTQLLAVAIVCLSLAHNYSYVVGGSNYSYFGNKFVLKLVASHIIIYLASWLILKI